MPTQSVKRVAYLFGAGATHAELQSLKPDLNNEKEGLLIGDVSSRVIERARRQKGYLEGLEAVSGTGGSLNIELLISLIESSKVANWAAKTELLKSLVQRDIQSVLIPAATKNFHLHKALVELHTQKSVKAEEQVTGFISLNYDDVLDRAYKQYFGEPNYCFSVDDAKGVPLLKLHGSFNWSDKVIRGRRQTVEIIPLGSNKTYLHVPYGFIWSRALEVLSQCDTLRVVGCALSQNDAHLVDLLFKAHLENAPGFEIEVIAPVPACDLIKSSFGFFPKITKLLDIERHLIPDRSPENPFKTWLKYKGIRMLGSRRIKQTTHLKEVVG